MAPSSDKKRALLSTVAAISKTLDDTDAEFGTASLPLPRLPTKTVPLNDATTTKPHRNASSIFSDPNVFERVSQSQQHTSNSQPSSRRSSLKNAAPQPRQPPPSQTSTGNLNSSNQQLKETLKHLENENRKLQFEKAALVSTLIDIKPQPQPQPQSQPQRRVIQMGGGSDSAFITGAVVDADRIAGTPNHFHYVAPSEMMQQSLNHPHPPPPQQQYSTFPQPSYSSLPQQSQQQQVYAPRQMQQMQVQPAQSHLQPVLVTGGVVDAVRSLTPNHVHYSVPVETMNILREPMQAQQYDASQQFQQQQQQQYQQPEPIQEDVTAQVLRRQNLDIDALRSQCDILAKENKRLRNRALELEELIISNNPSTTEGPSQTTTNLSADSKDATAATTALYEELRGRLNIILSRKTVLLDTLDRKTPPQGLPLNEVKDLLHTLSDAFTSALLGHTLPDLNPAARSSSSLHALQTSSFDIPAPLNDSECLRNLDAAIRLHGLKPDPTSGPPTAAAADTSVLEADKKALEAERAVLQDLAALYLGELDTGAAFRDNMSRTLTALHGELRALAHESGARIAAAEKGVEEACGEAMRAREAYAEIRTKFDPALVTVDLEGVVGPQMEKYKHMEFEVNRLKGVEATLEGIIKEWKRENETLRRMVDEVSGVAGGSGEDVNSIRKEMAKLRGTLEDEKLKYAKAKEVIRVLKESFGAASDVGGEGESSDDALLDIDALLAGGGLTGTAKGVASQYAKALHDAIGRSVVDFDELVLLLGENNALKSKNSELVIRLEEQGKRLTTSINECKTLKESLEKSRESHKKDNAHHESSIRELKDKLHHVQHDMTRFTTESAYYQEMTTSYLTQFSRIEALASDWFDVKSEHHLQVEAQLMHNKGAHPHLNRLISFDGIFSRLVAMLKETKTSLQESQATVAKLGSKLEAVTESERGLHEACSHQTATLETVKAAHEAQRVRIVEMEREVVEESGRRHALENKLRKVVRAAMAMLEIPIDAELVGQIHRSGGSALGALGKGAAQSLHSRPSPNRDYVAA